MRKIFSYFALSLVGTTIAAWLRMFDYSLSWGTWHSLIGQPLKYWVAAILVNPLVELANWWWMYLVATLFYLGFAWVWVRVNRVLRLLPAMLLGLLVGGGLCLLSQCLRQNPVRIVEVQVLGQKIQLHWKLYPLPGEVAEFVLIYALTGLLYGALFYRWVARPPSAL